MPIRIKSSTDIIVPVDGGMDPTINPFTSSFAGTSTPAADSEGFIQRALNPFVANFQGIVGPRKLKFDGPLNQDAVTVKFTVDSNGVPIGGGLLKTATTNPRGFRIINAVSVDNPTTVFATTQPFINFTSGTSNQVVKIIHISGLPANIAFNLTIVAEG